MNTSTSALHLNEVVVVVQHTLQWKKGDLALKPADLDVRAIDDDVHRAAFTLALHAHCQYSPRRPPVAM